LIPLQKEVEVILTRQLASYLAVPVFLVDPAGNLVYYNEPAEQLLGQRFEETGEMGVGAWATMFDPTDAAGDSIPPDSLPLIVALRERRPVHRDMWIRGHDGLRRRLEVTALPIVGQAGRFLGGIALFWEENGP
jgi:PAS domain-containing protein